MWRSKLAGSAHSSTRSHPGLRRTARLTALVVGAAVVTTAFAGPAAAAPAAELAQLRAMSKSQPKVHVVARGESLSSIAKTVGVSSWKRLYDANPSVAHPDIIHPGDKLVIPDAKAKLKSRPLPSTVQATSGRSRAVGRSAPQGRKWTASASTTRAPTRSGSSGAGSGVWDKLARCESSGNWGINTGNGYSGGLQFSPGTWRANGGSGSAHNASRSEQIRVAKRIQKSQGWGAWPACSQKIGLR
jgi:LysM repeat protein